MDNDSSGFVTTSFDDLVNNDSLNKMLSNYEIPELVNCILKTSKKDEFIEKAKNGYFKLNVNNLRTFHNVLKGELINNVTLFINNQNNQNNNINLLDLAVGKAGDMSKWIHSGINFVYGVDISSNSIKEAISRIKNNKQLKNSNTKISLAVADVSNYKDTINLIKKNKINKFNIVSCQFALHYFFKTKESLNNLLRVVSESLLINGFFIGTFIDSSKIKELLGKKKTVDTPLFTITKNYNNTKNNYYGNEYSFLIKDSLTNYFQSYGSSIEYLVDIPELNRVAAEYNLVPLNLNPFDYFRLSNESTINFKDIYSNNYKDYSGNRIILTPEEKELSFLNSVFIFVKIK